MKLKNYLIVIVFLIMSCKSLEIISDDVSQEYLDKTYGKYTIIKAKEFSKADLSRIKLAIINTVLHDYRVNYADKKDKIDNKSQDFEYVDNMFFGLEIMSMMVQMNQEELSIKLQITTNSGKEIEGYQLNHHRHYF